MATKSKARPPQSRTSYVVSANGMGAGEFTVYKTTKGEELHVFTPPTLLIKAIKPKRPEPAIPWLEIHGKLGVQKRPAGPEDPEWEAYARDMIAWRQEHNELQDDVQLVLALRDYKYPESLVFPPHIQALIDLEMLEVPDDPIQLKAMWLRSTVLEAQQDEVEITYVIQLRSGVPQEVIDQMKKNFLDNLLGRLSRGVAPANGDGSYAEDVEEDTVDLELETS